MNYFMILNPSHLIIRLLKSCFRFQLNQIIGLFCHFYIFKSHSLTIIKLVATGQPHSRPFENNVFSCWKTAVLQHRACLYSKYNWEGSFSSKRHYVQSIKKLLCLISDKVHPVFSLNIMVHIWQRIIVSYIIMSLINIFLSRNRSYDSRPPWIACYFSPNNIRFIEFYSFRRIIWEFISRNWMIWWFFKEFLFLCFFLPHTDELYFLTFFLLLFSKNY